jgi:hypothetical protein
MDRTGSGTLVRKLAYHPLPSQARFHVSPARFKGFSGPIGSGKSQALCQEAIKMSYVNPGRTGLVGAPTYPMLRDATVSSFLEILGQNDIPYELNKAENVMVMKDTRSRILFRAVEEFERLRGTNLAWFGVDELTYAPEEAWLRLEGRLRDPKATRLTGFAVWTPKGHDWVYRRFIATPVDGYEAVLARAFENRHLLEKVPDFYERLRSSYDAKFFQQEVMGEYLNASEGRVYHAFSRAEHVKELTLDPALPLLWALDFNVNPMCSVAAQIDGKTVKVVDEIVINRASTEEACREFHRRFSQHPQVVVVYGDASGNRMQTAGTTDYQIVREFFHSVGQRQMRYKVPAMNPQVRERVGLVNSKLKSALGEIQMWVSPHCVELIKDFEEVRYKPDSVSIDKDRDPRRTHLSDALGYLVWQECRPQVRAGERAQRLF